MHYYYAGAGHSASGSARCWDRPPVSATGASTGAARDRRSHGIATTLPLPRFVPPQSLPLPDKQVPLFKSCAKTASPHSLTTDHPTRAHGPLGHSRSSQGLQLPTVAHALQHHQHRARCRSSAGVPPSRITCACSAAAAAPSMSQTTTFHGSRHNDHGESRPVELLQGAPRRRRARRRMTVRSERAYPRPGHHAQDAGARTPSGSP